MATVIGVTAAKAQAIEDLEIVSAAVVSGQLILTKANGTTVNAGSIADVAHQTDSSTHGVLDAEGAIVGTLKTQTMTNKTLTSPVLTTPTIASHVNAQHNHGAAADGGLVDLPANGITGRSKLHFGSAVVTPAAGGKAVIAHGAPFGIPDQVLAMACDADATVQARSGIVCNVLTDTIGGTNFEVRLYRNDTAASHESPTRINYICYKT